MTDGSKINRQLGVSTAPTVEWLDPYIFAPPTSSQVLLLTWDNIQTQGIWGRTGHLMYAAWAHKPARQDWLKKRMSDKYIGQYKPKPVVG
jgi:hypothetical protein